jgi:hypothetical protein
LLLAAVGVLPMSAVVGHSPTVPTRRNICVGYRHLHPAAAAFHAGAAAAVAVVAAAVAAVVPSPGGARTCSWHLFGRSHSAMHSIRLTTTSVLGVAVDTTCRHVNKHLRGYRGMPRSEYRHERN